MDVETNESFNYIQSDYLIFSQAGYRSRTPRTGVATEMSCNDCGSWSKCGQRGFSHTWSKNGLARLLTLTYEIILKQIASISADRETNYVGLIKLAFCYKDCSRNKKHSLTQFS